jgi:hypothetical protein
MAPSKDKGRRNLLQESGISQEPPGVTQKVKNAKELQKAVQDGVAHIELVEHIDLTKQAPLSTAFVLGTISGDTVSIRVRPAHC